MKYTCEKNILILISELKNFGINKIVASPGTMNIALIGSIQNDPFFQIVSAPDERSAGYIACGMAKESGEPVVITCTGATASRNYYPALTEAFYSKIPIIAIVCTQPFFLIGHNIPQVLDRKEHAKDIVVDSIEIPPVGNTDEQWQEELNLNKLLNNVTKRKKGPGLITIVSVCSPKFDVNCLPKVRRIKYYCSTDKLPVLPTTWRIGIYVAEHSRWSKELTENVDSFCEKYNGVVFCDRTSNYRGKYGIYASLVCSQDNYVSKLRNVDLLIYIGNVFGTDMAMFANSVWRVNPDGEFRDPFRKLECVFEMEESLFFERFLDGECKTHNTTYYNAWKSEYNEFHDLINDDLIPFSNIWIAKKTLPLLPKCSVLHLAILNSLRSWSFFNYNHQIVGHANTGGFGIDGCMSTAVGASLVDPNSIYFLVIGDLAFFYDCNVLGNHYIGNNLRIMLINNGKGTEFRMYNHIGNAFGKKSDDYIAAGAHYGDKSPNLVKNLAENYGFAYMSASSKSDFDLCIKRFLTTDNREKSVIFEIFTNDEDESDALKYIRSLKVDNNSKLKASIKSKVKNIMGDRGISIIKSMIVR